MLLKNIILFFQKKKPVEKWEPGTECIAKYEFQGTTLDDLPFKKGELIVIVQASKVSFSPKSVKGGLASKNQNLACFVCYFKSINKFLKHSINVLKQIIWET